MERVMDKKREDAIVDAPRYECAEMATRFALSWLDRTRYHLKHIKRGKRSYYHDKLLVEVTAIEQALVDLVIKTNRAYDGHGLGKNNDLIYKPRFEDSGVRNVYERPGEDKPLKSDKKFGEAE